MESYEIGVTVAEKRALDAILEVKAAIVDLYGGRNPYNFVEEGIPAIHILQQFVRQHWAHRINPELWSDWTKDEPSRT